MLATARTALIQSLPIIRNLKKVIKILAVGIGLFFCIYNYAYCQEENSVSVIGKRLVFNDGTDYQTNLFDLQFIGQLNDEYLILSGRQCENCDANISIYVLSRYEKMQNESEQTRFSYPGKLYYFMDNKLIAEYRTFYGQVIDGFKGIIWYQKELADNDKWIESSYFLRLSDGQLKVDDSSVIGLDLTLEQVKKRLAFEIEGFEMTSEP